MKPAQDSSPWQGLHDAANVDFYIRAGLFVILALFGGLGAWAAIAPLSGAVIAVGVVKVDTNRKTVQHFEGGIVKEILVRDGDHVQSGQTLVVLQDERVGSTRDYLQGQLDSELARAARLQAERDGLDTIKFPESLVSHSDDTKVDEILKSETVYFNAKIVTLEERITLLRQQIKQTQEQIAGLEAQSRAEDMAIAYLQEEVSANEVLDKKRYVEKVHILGLKRSIEEYEARKGEHRADIAVARQKITDLELRIIDLKNARLNEAADKLTVAQQTINEIQERLRPARDATTRQTVVAPIEGTVVNLRVFTLGGIVKAGEPILDIVPEGTPLIIEAKVNVIDIDDLLLDQEADIRLSAYKTRSTPLVLGRLIYIAADSLVEQTTGQAYYLVHIEVDPESLREAKNLILYPGMPAEVFIKTGERTALDYLLAPITQTLRRSMRES